MDTTDQTSAEKADQEQTSNTPDYWAKVMVETIEGILRKNLSAGLPEDRKEAIKENIRRWVIDIREDEIHAIVREIEKTEADTLKPLTTRHIVKLLRERSPRRIP
jgi:hypothetical protein